MKAFVLSILLSLALMGTLSEATVQPERNTASIFEFYIELTASSVLTPDEAKAKYTAWNLLCFELRDVKCSGIKPPRVMTFDRNPLRPGLAGYYDGTDIIYIRNDLRGLDRLEVLAHEMSHYIDNEFGLLPEMPVYIDDVPGIIALCTSEKVAWAVSDAFNEANGRDIYVVGDDWVDWYAHCTPYKDILYPETP